MSKWKCGICNSEFENYHAEGFDNIIYCPLCYYKELYKRDKKEIERLNNIINELERWLKEDLKNNYRDAGCRHSLIVEILDKLKELKDSD